MSSRNNIFGYSNQNNEIRKRTWLVMVLFMLLFGFLIYRVSNYMYFNSKPLKTMADAQYTIDEKYGALYKVFDCNGEDLLNYKEKYYAIIDPVDYIRFNEYTSKYDLETLTITLRNYNKTYDLEKIKATGNGEKLRYEIDKVTYEKLKDIKKVKGFYTYCSTDVVKDGYWKTENILTSTTYNKVSVNPVSKKEVSNTVSKSSDSLEMKIYNKTKNNEYTKTRFSKGINGEMGAATTVTPKNNINVRLTIDKQIQEKVEEILHNEKYNKIGVVLMESSSGKIRAMAQKDDNAYNVNLGYPSTNGALPGSIFKVIVDEAGIDMNKIDKNQQFTINPKLFTQENFKGNTFTVAEALVKSSNNIFAQIGWKVGVQNIYNYARKQGMLSKVLDFQQEDIGNFQEDISNPTYAQTSQTAIGQNITITPLEALSIPNTIINNGVYVKPSIIDAYVNDKKEVLEKIKPKTSTVLKKETAETVKLHMIDVVNKGTGDAAYIKGMDIGGKTGTTTYDKGNKSDGWFVGFFTLNEKNYSMVVYVNDIKMNRLGIADEEGGGTAAPIFKKVVYALKNIQ